MLALQFASLLPERGDPLTLYGAQLSVSGSSFFTILFKYKAWANNEILIDTPTLEQLDSAIKTSDQWYVDYVSKLNPQDLSESIDFTFTDGALGRMSREEMLAHLVLHGDYHRGAISQILTQLSYPTPKPFTGFLHIAEPTARRRAG